MVIYPFITRAVRRTGITGGDEKRTGYYAGILESIFFLAESLTVYHMGRVSDLYGRKPILLIGPLGLSLAMLSFGLSQSFWGMVVTRAAMGVFNGNIGVSKTIMAESTDETNRADAFTLMPIVWTTGSTLGPTIGGVLADPAARWPHIFGKFAFFQRNPWFLSCFAAGFFAFSAFLLSLWGIKETLPNKVKRQHNSESEPLLSNDPETSQTYGSVENREGPSERPPTTRALLTDSKLRITLLSMAFLAFTDMSYQVLIPLIYTTSIPVGGLGLSPYQVGLILAHVGEVTPLIWALLIFQLFVSTVIVTAFNAMHLLVVINAPPNSLGSVNGLAQMISSGTRGLAPVFASSLYSHSLESQIAGGHLVEIVLIGVTIIGIYCISWLPH
ncbi:major facilitator superfamily multidrug- dha1 sub-family [Lentinula edodes]|uniref:Major facilitator superfamily multidrug-dha1 sub-family n=1 Tax=Lentinula edodes TaxID=5353 RepID=A0A1Q3E0K6_LENED|nr:major facilitator superfamily multidrug- dha1 sub-family [Lentinula edodes]